MNTLDALDAQLLRPDIPAFRPGDTLKVHVKVIEGSRSRIQIFQGVVIRRQGSGARETFTVRKISFGVGVERTFPVHSPNLERIELFTRGDVRRAKLYYLRELRGKAAKIKEKRDSPVCVLTFSAKGDVASWLWRYLSFRTIGGRNPADTDRRISLCLRGRPADTPRTTVRPVRRRAGPAGSHRSPRPAVPRFPVHQFPAPRWPVPRSEHPGTVPSRPGRSGRRPSRLPAPAFPPPGPVLSRTATAARPVRPAAAAPTALRCPADRPHRHR